MQILTVQELTRFLRDLLESEPLLNDVWVRGEVSNLSRAASGHCYFTVKDSASQLRCVLFRQQARFQTYRLENGAVVVAHGRVSLYDATGTLQLYVDLVQPDGIGEAHLQFERLRQQLAAEGLFDEARKRPLPAFPACIGVVTSANGAVWHDIVNIVGRRYPAVELVLAPAQVQGDGAPASIREALARLWALGRCDVIIVGRGGGSTEDLWAFNDEALARAIFASPVPVVSAVGHEVDVTIADYVADVRAPTPSAAAELVVPDRAALLSEVATLRARLRHVIDDHLDRARGDVSHAGQRLDWLSPRRRLRDRRQRVDDCQRALTALARDRVAVQRQTLAELSARLRTLDPRAVLRRGFAVVTSLDSGEVVARVGQASPGARLRVRVRDGAFGARVEPDGSESRP